MLCSQFLAAALRPIHSSHALSTQDSGPRCRRQFLQTGFRPNIAELLEDDGTIDLVNDHSTIRSIHLAPVANRDRNKVLLQPSPNIFTTETALPRHFRTTLSQLCSGQCSCLNSYRHTIDISDIALCPQCSSKPHTASHIFSCSLT